MSIRHEMITGRWTLLVEDSHADDDAHLDEVPLTGTVTFTPVWPEGVVAAPTGGDDEPLRLVAAQPVTALVADGILTDLQGREGQPLPVQIGEVELWWRARFNVAYEGIEVPLNPLLFDATEGPVELSTLISAKGYPDDDLSGLESIRATVRRQAREVAEALDLVNRAAESVEGLQRRATEAIEQAEAYVRQVKGLVDDAESIRTNTSEIRDEVHGWYEALSTDTKRIIDAVNGHLDGLAGDVTADADRAKREADRAGEAARVEVDRIKGDAPEAYDTLEEIAAWIGDAEDAAGGLIRSIAEKSDKGHGHSISEVDGLQDALDDKLSKASMGTRVYGTNSGGNQTMLSYSSAPNPSTLAYRGTGGTLQVGEPTDDVHATTRGWVEDRVQTVEDSIPTIAVVDEHPADPDDGTIYLVRE
ncbi:methyl-accepting chemotaxis protein [Corynebacterium glyciniphilum]|uniref:methyl-accepting chemotaxis protein n=1 Tax=Corynebacterium glyciniphilum TaxID=1404244 RepID=UPI0011AB8B62|nr:methyl-accepting chemotaxis protein [Corynebacterium glyciniphilum]